MSSNAPSEGPRRAGDTALLLGVWANDGNDFSLLDPILERFPERIRVQRFTWDPEVPAQILRHQLTRVDAVWMEGCSGPAVPLSRLTYALPVLCRFHRNTLHTDAPRQMDWAGVDQLVFHAPSLKQHFVEQYGAVSGEKTPEMDVVAGGVAVDEIAFDADRTRGYNVAFPSGIHYARDPMMALQIFRRLVDRDARFQLHIAGPVYHPELADYVAYQIQQLGLADHAHFYGPLDTARGAAYLQQCHYLLDTSVREDYPFGVLEGMAMGLKPVVHDFVGARDIFPPEVLFNTIEQALAMFDEPFAPPRYRRFVADHYHLNRQVDAYLALLDGLAAHYYPDRFTAASIEAA